MRRKKQHYLRIMLREINKQIEEEDKRVSNHYLELMKDDNLLSEIFRKSSGDTGSSSSAVTSDDKSEKAPSGDISGAGLPADNIKLIEKEMDAIGMTNGFARIALISVIGKESGLKPKSEKTYANTSVSRIKEIWPWLGNKYSDEELEKLKKSTSPSDGHKKPGLGLFDLVYCCKYGNGSRESGDGSRYRGRGFNQITWKGTYKKYANLTGVDILNNPDSLNDPAIAAKAAVKFLGNRLKSKLGTMNPQFTSQEEANRTLANANAGWGKKGSALARAIASTNKFSKKLSTSGGGVSLA